MRHGEAWAQSALGSAELILAPQWVGADLRVAGGGGGKASVRRPHREKGRPVCCRVKHRTSGLQRTLALPSLGCATLTESFHLRQGLSFLI